MPKLLLGCCNNVYRTRPPVPTLVVLMLALGAAVSHRPAPGKDGENQPVAFIGQALIQPNSREMLRGLAPTCASARDAPRPLDAESPPLSRRLDPKQA
jgi:hypothetical protein